MYSALGGCCQWLYIKGYDSSKVRRRYLVAIIQQHPSDLLYVT